MMPFMQLRGLVTELLARFVVKPVVNALRWPHG